MACSAATAFENVVVWTVMAPQNKKQKVATGLLLDKLYEQDFAASISARASKVFWTDQSLSSCGHLAPHENCITCFSYWVGSLLASYAFSAMDNARLKDFLITTNALVLYDMFVSFW